MLNFILQIGGSDSLNVAGMDAAAEFTETKISLISMVMKGGPVMIIMALLLIVSVYILIERLLLISKAGKKNPNLMLSLKETIQSGNISNALALCKNINTPEATMLAQGVSRIGQSTQEIRTAMDMAGSNEISKLEKNLNVLNIIGRIAPMFGF